MRFDRQHVVAFGYVLAQIRIEAGIAIIMGGDQPTVQSYAGITVDTFELEQGEITGRSAEEKCLVYR